jgi:hypothetical protein
MRLVRSGNHYIAQPGGTYVAPSPSAVQLALTDDSVTTVNLAGILPYPGSGTAALEVCSNGFVSVAAGNGNAWTPAAAGWLGSVQARWGCWHDWNPVAPGSGKVKFEQIGMVAYVTWDGVYSYNTTAPNTWQLQFDLNTGNVTYVFQSMVASGNGWLVGYAAAAPNTDLGNLDLSAALPGTFRTSADNAVALASTGTLPQLGTTLTLTSSNYPASSLLGLQLVGLQRFDPGIDLAILGMPGCLQHASLESLTPVFPVGGQASYLLPIPNNPSLMGFQLTGQAVAFVNGVNSAGLVTSNGVALTLGQ